MPEPLTKLLDKMKNLWSKLEKSQKIRLYILAGVLVAAIAVTVYLTSKVDYVPLFDSSEEVNLQPVVSYLTENGIAFKKGENQIFVDSKIKKDIEFDLATEGVVSPEVTFSDTWSKLSLTATEGDKENLWKNYLTNDLVYKLKKFDNVENATVQYFKPEKTYWVRNDEPEGSAYVMLKTKKALTADQVEAAVRVVASSLGISSDNITIVDENLNLLSRYSDQPELVRANTQDEMRRQRQSELENKVYDFFKVGIAENDYFDTLSVSANVVLDFDTLKSDSIKYFAPDEEGTGFIKNRETLEESVTDGNTGAAPGTDTNPQTAPTYQFNGDENSSYEKNQNVEERIFNQTNEKSEKAVGNLIADQSTMSISLWYGKKIAANTGLTDEYLEQVKQTAFAATGIPVENISVSVQKLAASEPPRVTLADTLSELFDRYGFYALMLILLVVMAITARPKRKEVPEELQLAAAEAAAGAAGTTIEEVKDINLEEQSELKKQIDKFVQQNPEAVAQLLRNWIADDWN
ncbi:MAG TPA: flagellar M-ring protein FliF [Ruminiclostridium sp.]|nr:flagellar M-ring protein FliF [Ruminiclostridium sp.]